MRILILTIALFSSTSSFAKCDPDNGYIQDCYDQTLKNEDMKLNVAYQRLMKLLKPEDQSKLREAERSWLQFVELSCRFESSAFRGGSIEPITYTRCFIKETVARTTQLNESSYYEANGLCYPSDANCQDKLLPNPALKQDAPLTRPSALR